MFMSMSTARIAGVTFSGFSLLCNEGRGSQSTTRQDNQMQICLFSVDCLVVAQSLSPEITLRALLFRDGIFSVL